MQKWLPYFPYDSHFLLNFRFSAGNAKSQETFLILLDFTDLRQSPLQYRLNFTDLSESCNT